MLLVTADFGRPKVPQQTPIERQLSHNSQPVNMSPTQYDLQFQIQKISDLHNQLIVEQNEQKRQHLITQINQISKNIASITSTNMWGGNNDQNYFKQKALKYKKKYLNLKFKNS